MILESIEWIQKVSSSNAQLYNVLKKHGLTSWDGRWQINKHFKPNCGTSLHELITILFEGSDQRYLPLVGRYFLVLFCEITLLMVKHDLSLLYIHTYMSYCLSVHYLNHMACDISSLDFNRQLDGWSWWWCRWLISLSSWQQLSFHVATSLCIWNSHGIDEFNTNQCCLFLRRNTINDGVMCLNEK